MIFVEIETDESKGNFISVDEITGIFNESDSEVTRSLITTRTLGDHYSPLSSEEIMARINRVFNDAIQNEFVQQNGALKLMRCATPGGNH